MSSTMEIKQQNLNSIRDALQTVGTSTKNGLSKATGLSVATCNNLLNEMHKSGELLLFEQEASSGGRKANCYAYNKDFQHVLSVYIKIVRDVRNVGYAIANALGHIIEQKVLQPEWIDYDYLANLMSEIVSQDSLIQVASVAIPGNVYQGTVENCDIHSLEGLNLEDMLQERLGVSVIVENDMNFIAYGTYWKMGEKARCLVAIDFPIDDPVGAGIVIDGKIYKGFSRFAGELSYALEEEGIPRAQQPVSKMDKTGFFRIVVKSIMMIICVLNPDRIILMCDCLEEGDVPMIKDYCMKFVSKNHIPEIQLSREFYDSCVVGMTRASLNSLRYQFQLTI